MIYQRDVRVNSMTFFLTYRIGNTMYLKQMTQTRVVISLLFLTIAVILSSLGIADAQELSWGGICFGGSVGLDEINDLLVEQGHNFEAFKKKHVDKLNLLEKEVMELAKKANRPNIGGQSYGTSEQHESKNDLADYIRSRGESKGMFSGSAPDGGFTVMPVLADGIGGLVRNTSALRQLITQFVPLESGDAYEEVISITPVAAKWVAESEARPGTTTPKLVKVTTALNEEYAAPVLSQRLADDSSAAMVDFLVNECSLSFTEAEETALFFGTGIGQPRGLDTIATAATADDTRPFGTIEHIPTGVSGDFAATDPFDAVKKVFYKLRAGYRTNAKWVCNSETAMRLSLLQDGQGNYLWDEGNVKDGTPPTLLGKPVVVCETAPGIAANAKALWFGDWDQAMRGIERPGNKLLLDPYTDKPNIVVYVYRRVGVSLRNSNAVKCLKFSAS